MDYNIKSLLTDPIDLQFGIVFQTIVSKEDFPFKFLEASCEVINKVFYVKIFNTILEYHTNLECLVSHFH